MAFFVRLTALYFIGASVLNFVLREDAAFVGAKLLVRTDNLLGQMLQALPFLAILFAFAIWRARSVNLFVHRLAMAFIMLVLCCVFMSAFSSMKTLLPAIVAASGQSHFFADPFFAAVDKALHFGTDPWGPAHALTQSFGLTDFASHASTIYGLWWALPAFYLPAFMVLIGEDGRKLRHFLILYGFAWIVLGNLTAAAGLSAGPIYYDRVFGTERFAELHTALVAGGIETSWLGLVQPVLWEAYTTHSQAVGSGISAFPSMHLAMATVTAVYLGTLSKWLGVVGWVFVAAIMFVSVWSGYHYAIDGYFSIAVIFGLHVYLSRRPHTETSPQTQATLSEGAPS